MGVHMAFEIKYRLSYYGGEADNNRLPAHNGALSLEGVTWSFSLLAHYAATGKIKTRGQLSSKVEVYLAPARQGSFLQDLYVVVTEPNNIFLTTVAGSYAVATLGQLINSLVVTSLRGVCGLPSALSKPDEGKLSKLPSGDREALVDRIEPSMRRAHEVIDDGATQCIIKKGYTPLLTMDAKTKAYVNADLLTDEKMLVVSVGAYNANTGNGSVYLTHIGKSVPFSVEKGLDHATYAALSFSLDRYVNNLESNIEVACLEQISTDNRTKKLIIKRAFK